MAMASALVAAMAVGGCARLAPAMPGAPLSPTEPGSHAAPLTGYLLFNEPAGAIRAVRLPSLEPRVVKAGAGPGSDRATIHALSGPDREGRIAYIEDHSFVADKSARRHLLKIARIDGRRGDESFVRPGGALWATTAAGQGEIGNHLALSVSGGRVAFVSGLNPVQLPSAYLHVGHLEVWNLETKLGGNALAEVLDEGLAWFPDGRRLAFVKLVNPAEEPNSAAASSGFGHAFLAWGKVAAVFVLDIDSGTERFLTVGWRPVVSGDGTRVLVTDNEGNARAVEAVSGRAVAMRLPGKDCPTLVAAPAPGLVLARCKPGKGEDVEYTRNNSPLAGPKPMQMLSAVRTDAGIRQHLIRSIDPRTAVSFGPGPMVGE